MSSGSLCGKKRELLCKLQQICRLSTYGEADVYGAPELTAKLSSMLEPPEEAYAHIGRFLEKEPDRMSRLRLSQENGGGKEIREK